MRCIAEVASISGGFSVRAQHSEDRFPERDLAPNESLVLSGITPTNNRVDSSDKRPKRMLKKQIQFVTKEALEKRVVSMFLHHDVGF